jgi:hypothetical protein
VGALAPRLNAFASDTGDDTAALGKAVQVDPVKPMLKPPETKRLKPKCDGPLSNFAFEFNLRRYTWVRGCGCLCWCRCGGIGWI